MPDTMTLTKAVAAICAAMLVLLFSVWGADELYSTAPDSHGGHGEEVAQAYTIDTGAPAEGGEAAAEGPAFAEVFAAADAGAGEKVWSKCKACHKLDGTDGTGPHLNGVVGRAKAASAGFGYSDALVAMAAETWTPENLEAFLANPKKYAPGTKMSFAGLPKVEDRANLIAYLATQP
jgi:cytochrome c